MMDHPPRAECCVHGQARMCDKGKIPNEYPFSFLAHLLLYIKENGISLQIQCSLNGSSFNVHTSRTPQHTQCPYKQLYTWHTSLDSVKWPIQPKQQEAEGWRARKLMNARFGPLESAICMLFFPSSQESPIKPLHPLFPHSCPIFFQCPWSPKLYVCIKTRPDFWWFTDQCFLDCSKKHLRDFSL